MLPLLLALPAQAYVYWTEAQLLAEIFPGESPERLSWSPDAADLAQVKAALGYAPPRPSYTLWVGSRGVLVLDQQVGQHEPIDLATLVVDGRVERVEILVYREAYGDGVRSDSFRDQFTGKTVDNPLRVGKEIRVVSGATLSSRALSVAVRRALALVEAWGS